ncbi:MAG: tetratricopeptide repeat protein [Planctomycetota bacterium]
MRRTQPQAGSSSSRISSSKSSRIGSIISTRKTTIPNTRKPSAGSSGNRISSSRSLLIGSSVRDRKTPVPSITERPARSSKQGAGITGMVGNRSSRVSGKAGLSRGPRDGHVSKEPEERLAISRQHKSTNIRDLNRLSPGSRIRKVVPERQTSVVDTVVVSDAYRGDRTALHSYRIGRSPHVVYHDRPHVISHAPHYEHSYMDWRNRLCYRTVWPRYRFMVHYSFGPWSTFRYFYPYYHRKYIFVSLGGYWPLSYRYRRYYWYGYHPYIWSGYYPIAREVQGDTYNYYTYNYYNDDNVVGSASSQVIDGIQLVDHNTFADIREKLAQQATEEPGEVTLADTYFEAAVKAFEAGNYDVAIEKFAEAMELAPDDIILPFAYSQALFAKEQYSEAAEVLRGTLANVLPEKEGVFYPRGLYPDDDGLFEQINLLAEKAELYSFDADLQLLLGYQLLGIGKLDEAVEPLQRASRDMENAVAATTLLNVLEKIRAENEQ